MLSHTHCEQYEQFYVSAIQHNWATGNNVLPNL